MGFFDRFVDRGSKDPSVAQKRVRSIPTDDLATWIDNTVSQVGRDVRAYFTTADAQHLGEARIGVETLLEMISEVERRSSIE